MLASEHGNHQLYIPVGHAHGIDVDFDIPDGEYTIPCFGTVNRSLRALKDKGLTITVTEKNTIK